MKTSIPIGAAVLMFMRPLFADPVPVTVHNAPRLSPGAWVNSGPIKVDGDTGKVRVVLFWTHLCINCKHNLPYWESWTKEYKGSDVQIVSVHTPETDSEKLLSNVRRFVTERHLTFPVVTDNSFSTWNAYGVHSWPTEILIDKHGRIRYQFEGELNWDRSGEYKVVHSLIEKLRHES